LDFLKLPWILSAAAPADVVSAATYAVAAAAAAAPPLSRCRHPAHHTSGCTPQYIIIVSRLAQLEEISVDMKQCHPLTEWAQRFHNVQHHTPVQERGSCEFEVSDGMAA
jgi:hypothetical protein